MIGQKHTVEEPSLKGAPVKLKRKYENNLLKLQGIIF